MKNRKLVLYIASSLDGYIATEEENLDWLLQTEGEGDNGYGAFYDTIDTILLGRVTYDWILKHEHGNFPYQGKECYVFTRTTRKSTSEITFVNEDVVEFTKKLKAKDGKKIWLVGGGKLLDAFLREQLVDEIILTIAPVMLGSGIPLFYEQKLQQLLRLESVKKYGQFVELHYIVKNGEI